MLRTLCDGLVAKPGSMLNVAIFDPWQRSLFSRQPSFAKEVLESIAPYTFVSKTKMLIFFKRVGPRTSFESQPGRLILEPFSWDNNWVNRGTDKNRQSVTACGFCCYYLEHSQLQKCKRTGTSFLYWLDWKSKHFNWNVIEWKATLPSLRVFSRILFKWEPCKSCKIPNKSLEFCGLSTQSIQTLYFRWCMKSYHFILLLL